MLLDVLRWHMLNVFLNYFMDNLYNKTKRIRNFISFVHSLLCVYQLCIRNFTFLHTISNSYYIYDSSLILVNCWKKEFMYIYHHFVSILLLLEFDKFKQYELYQIYCIAEVSNFFSYIVYEMLKNGSSQKIIIKLKYAQVMWYVYFRVFYFTYFIFSKYNLYTNLKLYNQLGGFSIYLLGLGWTFNQYKLLI